MYKVIQIDEEKGRAPVWCTAEDDAGLMSFCQYLADSARPEGLEGFVVLREEDGATERLPSFLERNGIRKRSFEERMGIAPGRKGKR